MKSLMEIYEPNIHEATGLNQRSDTSVKSGTVIIPVDLSFKAKDVLEVTEGKVHLREKIALALIENYAMELDKGGCIDITIDINILEMVYYGYRCVFQSFLRRFKKSKGPERTNELND